MLRLFFGDVAVVHHLLKHVALPLLGALMILGLLGRVVVGPFWKPGQQRRLTDVELANLFSKVVPSGFLNAIAAVAEENLVRIERENLFFGERLLHAPR